MTNENNNKVSTSKNSGLYIHIPFCIQKCAYCDFNSYDDRAYLIDDYINAVLKELRVKKEKVGLIFNTLYIGGGTPTFLSVKQLESFFSGLYSIVDKKNFVEMTIEANPETVTEEKTGLLKTYVNRISLGAQSFSNGLLKKLGRIHDADKAYKAVETIKKHIDNFSIDLMYGIHGEEKEDIFSDIKKSIGLSPKHISFYMLTAYQDTEYFDMLQTKSITLPDDEEIESMYMDSANMLEKNSYLQYEISNFAKQGYECLHNMNYWKMGEYLGVGAGAASFFSNERYKNTEDPAEYIKRINNNEDTIMEKDIYDDAKYEKDYIMLNLRKKSGVSMLEYAGIFKIDFYKKYCKIIDKFADIGLVDKGNENISLTRKGFLLSNSVIEEFF